MYYLTLTVILSRFFTPMAIQFALADIWVMGMQFIWRIDKDFASWMNKDKMLQNDTRISRHLVYHILQ